MILQTNVKDITKQVLNRDSIPAHCTLAVSTAQHSTYRKLTANRGESPLLVYNYVGLIQSSKVWGAIPYNDMSRLNQTRPPLRFKTNIYYNIFIMVINITMMNLHRFSSIYNMYSCITFY